MINKVPIGALFVKQICMLIKSFDDGKVLLIYPKSDEQEIKQIAGQMVTDFGQEYK